MDFSKISKKILKKAKNEARKNRVFKSNNI